MKKAIHPEYKLVVFKDISSGLTVLTKSTATSEETITLEGETYPLIRVEISSKSHPFYTGKQRIVDTENRVKSFEERLNRKSQQSLESKREKRAKRRAKVQEIKANKEITLKDMLKQMQ